MLTIPPLFRLYFSGAGDADGIRHSGRASSDPGRPPAKCGSAELPVRLTDFSQHHILNFYHPEYMRLRIEGGLTHGRRSGPVPEITFLQHHLCHAASAFYVSGFEESAVLTIDGSGEEQSTVLWRGDRSGLTQLESVDLPHSFGWLYAAITEFLGFRPYSDEGSVMGLACYGAPVDEIETAFDKIVRITDHGSEIDPYLMANTKTALDSPTGYWSCWGPTGSTMTPY